MSLIKFGTVSLEPQLRLLAHRAAVFDLRLLNFIRQMDKEMACDYSCNFAAMWGAIVIVVRNIQAVSTYESEIKRKRM